MHHFQRAVIITKCKWDVWDSRRSQRAARDSTGLQLHTSSPRWVTFSLSLCAGYYLPLIKMQDDTERLLSFSEWFPCDIIKRICCDHEAGSGFALTGQAQECLQGNTIISRRTGWLTRKFGRMNELKLIFDNTTLSQRSPDKLWKDITSSRGTSFSVHKADID